MPTLEQAKQHLRIDHYDEDDLILAMIDAATQSVADYLDMDVEDMQLLATPAPVEAAILLRVADLFENREAQQPGPLIDNRTFIRLLAPYRVVSI